MVLEQMLGLLKPVMPWPKETLLVSTDASACTANHPPQDVFASSEIPDNRVTILRGHLITDIQGTIQLADRAMAKLLHCAQAQLLGQRFQDLFTEDVSEVLSGYLHKIEQGEPGVEWDISLSSKHGPTFWALISLTAIQSPDGLIASVHWLIQDVTAHQRAIAADTLLQSLGEQVLAGLTFSQLSELICDRLVQTFDYPLVWIGSQNGQGVFEVVSSAGSPEGSQGEMDALVAHEASSLFAKVMRARHARLISNEDPEIAHWSRRMLGDGLRSGLCVPLCSDRADLGVLMVMAATTEAFDPVVTSWFEQLGARLAVSLFMVKQYEQLRVRDAAIASAEHAVFITDPTGCIEWVNSAYARLTGHSAEELLGKTPVFLQKGLSHLLDQEAHRPQKPGQYSHQELVFHQKDGRSFTVEQIVTPLRNEKGEVTHFVAIHHDITVRKESEAHIYHLAHYDSLTDLPNRVMFRDRLQQALAQARRYGHTVAVMFLDLDRFKPINDRLGHDRGDELLCQIARRLAGCVRESDTVARLSGDEFAIILQDLDRGQDAGHVAQKVLDAVSAPLLLGEVSVSTTASLGISLYPIDGTDPEVLLTRADRGMYRAKEKGGDCYQFVSDELNAQAFERLLLERGLTRALDHSEFVLHYQPEVDMRTKQVLGIESLIRWQHEELGLVFPSQFMSLAEGLKILSPIQNWVLHTALLQFRTWDNEGLIAGPMVVKIFLGQSSVDSILNDIKEALCETGVSADHLKIALSYGQVLRHVDEAKALVQGLAGLGVFCVLDDVDSSESLGHLLSVCSFPVLKVGTSVMFGVPSDPDAVGLLQACLSYGAKFNMTIVAKGIESPVQLAFLREHDCHCMQGYLIGRPLPVHEMTMALRAR